MTYRRVLGYTGAMQNPKHIVEQYRAAMTSAVFAHRTDRGLIEAKGKDRVGWLSNLVTNILKTLKPGDGAYAFATNIKGRTVFDVNILLLEDRLWLDVDRRLVEKALAHLNRYIITEDVVLSDITPDMERVALLGPEAHKIIERLGLGNLVPMPYLQHHAGRMAEIDVRLVRNDFAGPPAAELIFASGGVAAISRAIDSAVERAEETDAGRSLLLRIERSAMEILRIEYGLPASVDDIDDDVVPPETGQIERGISYHKGCYLGQEVIERMRSHGILARKLVGIKVSVAAGGDTGGCLPAHNTPVFIDGKEMGRVTSACWSERFAAPLALGYVKTQQAVPGKGVELRTGSSSIGAEVVALPVHAS